MEDKKEKIMTSATLVKIKDSESNVHSKEKIKVKCKKNDKSKVHLKGEHVERSILKSSAPNKKSVKERIKAVQGNQLLLDSFPEKVPSEVNITSVKQRRGKVWKHPEKRLNDRSRVCGETEEVEKAGDSLNQSLDGSLVLQKIYPKHVAQLDCSQLVFTSLSSEPKLPGSENSFVNVCESVKSDKNKVDYNLCKYEFPPPTELVCDGSGPRSVYVKLTSPRLISLEVDQMAQVYHERLKKFHTKEDTGLARSLQVKQPVPEYNSLPVTNQGDCKEDIPVPPSSCSSVDKGSELLHDQDCSAGQLRERQQQLDGSKSPLQPNLDLPSQEEGNINKEGIIGLIGIGWVDLWMWVDALMTELFPPLHHEHKLQHPSCQPSTEACGDAKVQDDRASVRGDETKDVQSKK